jgi:trans-aconitate methyltransferase
MNTPENRAPSPTSRLWHLAREYAEQFQDQSVVDAYHLRPYYPEETFELLTTLGDPNCRRVLDVGCGTGEIARRIAPRVSHVDAVDISPAMLTRGKGLPGGNASNLRWIEGEVETVALTPPYGLITAASSLHWMEWAIVLPRFAHMLTPNGVLAILFEHASLPEPDAKAVWKQVRESLTGRGIPLMEPFDLIEELRQRHLLRILGEQWTEPISQEQSIADYVESFHARNGFSRERMGVEAAEAFDSGAMQALQTAYPDGNLVLRVQMRVVWGRPNSISSSASEAL